MRTSRLPMSRLAIIIILLLSLIAGIFINLFLNTPVVKSIGDATPTPYSTEQFVDDDFNFLITAPDGWDYFGIVSTPRIRDFCSKQNASIQTLAPCTLKIYDTESGKYINDKAAVSLQQIHPPEGWNIIAISFTQDGMIFAVCKNIEQGYMKVCSTGIKIETLKDN